MDPRFNGIVWTGSHLLDVRDPNPDLIKTRDIARGLSRKNRFGGHTRDDLPAYPITWHSLFCEAVADQMGLPLWVRFQALLHDAPEYILSDIITPVKALLAGYHPLESGLWRAIAQRFQLPAEFHPAIHEIDALALEAERFFLVTPNAWHPKPEIPAEWAVMAQRWFEFALSRQGSKPQFSAGLFVSRVRALEEAMADGGNDAEI